MTDGIFILKSKMTVNILMCVIEDFGGKAHHGVSAGWPPVETGLQLHTCGAIAK